MIRLRNSGVKFLGKMCNDPVRGVGMGGGVRTRIGVKGGKINTEGGRGSLGSHWSKNQRSAYFCKQKVATWCEKIGQGVYNGGGKRTQGSTPG